MKHFLVFTKEDPKVKYVLDYFFKEFCSATFEVVGDWDSFCNDSSKLKINYSTQFQENIINIPYSGYFEGFDIHNTPHFEKKIELSNSTISFDLFAATFFILARVEEYRPFEPDAHNRFTHNLSVQYERGILEDPILDQWMICLRNEIVKKSGIELITKEHKEVLSTIDIDHIYAFKEKPFTIRLGSVILDLLKWKITRIKDRFDAQDPYDTFEKINYIHKELNLNYHSFVLTTERSKFDKSFSPNSRQFKLKIKELAKNSQAGIHPSYYSNNKPEIIREEKNRLETAIGYSVTQSRFHFIKLNFPHSYKALIRSGIEEDYSMGYPEMSGFRAGVARPFMWFDLDKNKVTSLKIFPFQTMDVTLKKYENLNPTQAFQKAKVLVMKTQDVMGQFGIIWHNSSFYDNEGWGNWETTYKHILAFAIESKNNQIEIL